MARIDRGEKHAPEKNNRGRPTGYRKKYCKEVVEFMSKGKSLTAFLAHIGVYEPVFTRWRQEFPDLDRATKLGIAKNQQWFEEIMLAHITGAHKSPKANSEGKYLAHGNANMLRWAMSMRFKDYREKLVEPPDEKSLEVVYRSYVNEDGMIVAEREEVKIGESNE